MRVRELARRAGVPQRTVRFYADDKLITPVRRSAGGYREFDERALRVLRFVRHLQRLGLTLAQIRPLVRAAERGDASATLRASLERQLAAVDARLAELTSVAHELRALVSAKEVACRDELCICRCRDDAARARSPADALGRAEV
ncbi:MAG TPA: MerR family transcriptional regulator, partial [Candidatus Limnocylindria bacterium]